MPDVPKRTVLLSAWFSPEEAAKVREAAKGSSAPAASVLRAGALQEAERLTPGGRKCRHCGERG